MIKLIIVPLKRIVAKITIQLSSYFYYERDKNFIFSTFYNVLKHLLEVISITPFEILDNKNYYQNFLTSDIHQLSQNRNLYSSYVTYRLDYHRPLVNVKGSDISMITYKNIKIHGNSDLIIDQKNHCVISDLAYNLKAVYTNYDGALWRQRGKFALLKYKNQVYLKNFENAIMLSGKFSENYYHVLYEILIKLVIINTANIPNSVPLLIDESILKIDTFKQLLITLNTSNREIIEIGKKDIFSIDILYTITEINHIPPHIKDLSNIDVNDFYFDALVLKKMRALLLRSKSNKIFSTKIFITRKVSKNRKYNEPEIANLLVNKGFIVVAPEQMNLYDQMALFFNAEIIIGASGGALSNILFCNKNCKIICLQARRLNLPIFSTVAKILNLDMRYIEGKPVGLVNKNHLHANFEIDLNELEKLIDAVQG